MKSINVHDDWYDISFSTWCGRFWLAKNALQIRKVQAWNVVMSNHKIMVGQPHRRESATKNGRL
jgi:hypothetical protein